jgi:hypothetical protein
VGRFIKSLNYSGPASIVHVETNARDGRNVYVDRDYVFAGLPADLVGADWIQLADPDARQPDARVEQRRRRGGRQRVRRAGERGAR